MDLLILIAVMVVLAIPIIFFAGRKDRREEQRMSPVVRALGARYTNQVIRGEKEGVKFQIALLSHVSMANPLAVVGSAVAGAALGINLPGPKDEILKGVSSDRFVVRAKVPSLLPLGLVAVPSTWLSRSHRSEISKGLCGDPELEGAYIFRTNDPEKSRKLLEDTEVRQALKTLMQRPPGVGLVFDDCVHIAYDTDTYPKMLESPEEARRCVDTVVQAALVLDRVYSRIQEAAGLS